MDTDSIWIFGYGSLVFKTNFSYTDKLVGHLKGYHRRFWQGSSDHRGTCEKPGRVATIIPTDNPEDEVWGIAYKLDENEIEMTFDYLNHREKNGYILKSATFYPKDYEEKRLQPFVVPLYISAPDNPHFLGPGPVAEMAHHIHSSIGPSGANLDYFLNVVDFMKYHAPHYKDNHLFELEVHVRELMSKSNDVDSISIDDEFQALQQDDRLLIDIVEQRKG